ncbi:MAG: DUF935 domain-containing protein [Polyangiaceae bacterium]|jgi:hypothetical protein|nr:DUF935 domain-containing protein [Polyangiaceae bacterium]
MPSLLARLGDRARALLSVSAFDARPPAQGGISDALVERIRLAVGGNLTPLPTTQTRWYLADLESAIRVADSGDLSKAAQLYRAFRRDGVLSGLLSTCTDGLVRLPKRFYGDPEQIRQLEPRNGTRSVFDEMAPPQELALLAADGRMLGVGVGELVPVPGRSYPVLRRLEPEFLRYRWNEGRWYFASVAGLLPISSGDGRFVLHCPGGHMAPWQFGMWQACGRAWINKEHALLHRSNFSAKLANPARVAVAPLGATEEQRVGFLARVMAWGINTVFEMPVGWDVKLIESNGRGFDVFQQEITSSDLEFMVAIAGQIVTTTGGTGFANADVHKSIRADIIQSIADSLAYTVNTQILPAWTVDHFGVAALESRAVVEWDVAPPKDRAAEANSLLATANAIKAMVEALAPFSRSPDVVAIAQKFGVPMAGDADNDGTPDENNVVELPVAAEEVDPDGDGLPGEPATDEAVRALADKMTKAGIERCEHGAVNRCRLCGIERVRDFETDADGAAVWKVIWRPIPGEVEVEAEAA